MLMLWWSKYGSIILLVLLALYLLRMYLYFKNKLKMPKMHFYSLIMLAAFGPVWVFYWVAHSHFSHVLLFSIYIVIAAIFFVLGVSFARKHKLLWRPVTDTLLVPALFYKTTVFMLVPIVVLLALLHIWWHQYSQVLLVQILFLLLKASLSGLYLGGAVVYIYQAAHEKYIVEKS